MTVPTPSTPTSAPNLDALPLEGASEDSHVQIQQHQTFPHHFTDEDLPPLRLNASRVPERLSASTSSIQIPPALAATVPGRRRPSLDSKRNRSRSPSLTKDDSSYSGCSSLEDSDILTDRMGLEELSDSCIGGHVSVSSLPSVNERLSEDTLEDVHAFSGVKRSGGASIATSDVGSLQLGTLDECEEWEGDEEEDDGNGAGAPAGVHISGLEHLTIEEEQEGEDVSLTTDAAEASCHVRRGDE